MKRFYIMYNITINVICCSSYNCASHTNLEQSVLLAKQHKSSVMCSTEREKKFRAFKAWQYQQHHKHFTARSHLYICPEVLSNTFLKGIAKKCLGVFFQMFSPKETQDYSWQLIGWWKFFYHKVVWSNQQNSQVHWGEGRQIRFEIRFDMNGI